MHDAEPVHLGESLDDALHDLFHFCELESFLLVDAFEESAAFEEFGDDVDG